MAYDTEIANIENYYADLLIIQYRNKPNARATIKLGVDLYLADGLIFDLNNVLDIDTAVGQQLDLIGKILGVNRKINGFTFNVDFFSFENISSFIDTVADNTELAAYDTTGLSVDDIIKVLDDSNHDNETTYYQWNGASWVYVTTETPAYGYSDKNTLSQGYWKQYQNSVGSVYSMSDDDYRVLLKFKALYNVRYGSWACMDLLYWRAFGDEITLVNNKDLTVSYTTNSPSIGLQVAQFLGYIEPPLGIGIV